MLSLHATACLSRSAIGCYSPSWQISQREKLAVVAA